MGACNFRRMGIPHSKWTLQKGDESMTTENGNPTITIEKYSVYFHKIHNKFLKSILSGDETEKLLIKLTEWEAMFDKLSWADKKLLMPIINKDYKDWG